MSFTISARRPEEASVRVERERKLVPLFARVVDGAQVLPSVLDPLDGPLEPKRGTGDEKVLRVELPARPEAAADVGLDESDAVLGPTEHRREHPAVEVGDLGRSPYREPARTPECSAVGCGHETPSLHGHRAVSAGPEREAHDAMRACERPLRCPRTSPR